jgi:NAD(P)-dependent dehydrogenase (short-subunit alcohol dehydrogenase family)
VTGEKSCAGGVCIVTGAGTGLGRSHALTLAKSGARVVVNDLGAALDGIAEKESAAQSVVGQVTTASTISARQRLVPAASCTNDLIFQRNPVELPLQYRRISHLLEADGPAH